MSATTLPIRVSPVPAAHAARVRWAVVEIETDTGARYSGRVFVSDTRQHVTDVLTDDRPFLFVRDATVSCAHEVERFVAINKRFVRTVRILEDSELDCASQARLRS